MDDKRYMLETLGEYQRRAHNESLGKGISPKPRMMELLATDLRFKEFDHGALAMQRMAGFAAAPALILMIPLSKAGRLGRKLGGFSGVLTPHANEHHCCRLLLN